MTPAEIAAGLELVQLLVSGIANWQAGKDLTPDQIDALRAATAAKVKNADAAINAALGQP